MRSITINQQKTSFYYGSVIKSFARIEDKTKLILLVDKHVLLAHPSLFKKYNCFTIPSGEKHKQLSIIKKIIDFLIAKKADRKTFLVGIGGGVVTDITGFVGSIYMRGIRFGFVPTTLLAMVDASLGGKNGIDWGMYKNMVGNIVQPQFLHYDYALLNSLPQQEWINGFAEIIKHASVFDASLFSELEKRDVDFFRHDPSALRKLIEINMKIKYDVVLSDPFEKGRRRLLNFGHTMGHAIEQLMHLPHGSAISIGMSYMAVFSFKELEFDGVDRLIKLFDNYGLPTSVNVLPTELFQIMRQDKKQENNVIFEVLLDKIGLGRIASFPLKKYEQQIKTIISNGS